jgi:hypothetical protein
MNASEESLFKLLLTVDMDQQERSFAQHLGKTKPNALFYPNSGFSSPTKAKPSNKSSHAYPLIRYQFEASDGRMFNCDMTFYSSSNFIAVHVLRAGEIGGARVNFASNNCYYQTSQYARDCDLESAAWQQVLTMMSTLIKYLEDRLPADIDATLTLRATDKDKVAAMRKQREQKKELMKVGVFHKFKVKSTPETELLFKVCSRMGTEQSVVKAFGELLPLITGEFDGSE